MPCTDTVLHRCFLILNELCQFATTIHASIGFDFSVSYTKSYVSFRRKRVLFPPEYIQVDPQYKCQF
jgi:hypothetical protein